MVLSPEIISEIENVLRRPKIFKKYGPTESLIARLIDAFNSETLVIQPPCHNPVPDIEPSDLKFLACADAGAADYLVTGDQTLLNLKTTNSPASFLPASSSVSFNRPPITLRRLNKST